LVCCFPENLYFYLPHQQSRHLPWPAIANHLQPPLAFPSFLLAGVSRTPEAALKVAKHHNYKGKTLQTVVSSSTTPKKSVEGGVPVVDGRTLPLLLGVGPAKTSSTALFNSLGQHPEIILGNVSLLGHACCGSELYYFSRRFNRASPGAGLGEYFSIDTKPNANWVAEKTPEYSDHFLAPYRVRETLRPPHSLALVFTIRDPVDAHVSLYFYRMQRKNLQSSAQGFLEWSRGLLQAHHVYRKCAQTELVAQKYKEPISTEMSPRWIGVQRLDTAVFEKCRQPYFKPSDRLEGVGSLEYSHTLPRWKRVLDTRRYSGVVDKNKTENKASEGSSDNGDDLKTTKAVPMMCVFHQDFIRNPEKETKKVAKFIGLDPERLRTDLPAGSRSTSTAGLERSGEERVFAAHGAKDEATAIELLQHMRRLRGFFSGEMEFARQFCSRL
jgi:hypothetical protein